MHTFFFVFTAAVAAQVRVHEDFGPLEAQAPPLPPLQAAAAARRLAADGAEKNKTTTFNPSTTSSLLR